MSDATPNAFDPDLERATEVEDYTGEVPRTAPEPRDDPPAAPEADPATQATGFGDGDVADVDDHNGEQNVEGDIAELVELADHAQQGVDVDALIAERDQFKDLAMRLQADFENYRKRTAANTAADIERATAKLAEALLPVLDAVESAYVAHPDEVGPLFNLMLTELKKHGLEALDLAGKPFDPEVAEAVAHVPGEGGEITIAEVLRSGYTWRGRTLRAAMVRTTD